MTTQVATETITKPKFNLTPPDEVAAIVPADVPEAVSSVVKLPDADKAKVDKQLDAFVTALLSEDVRTDAFRSKLDSAFSLGRQEIAAVTTLSNSYTKKNFVGEEDSPAYKAISEMRSLFDELNPAKQGDLFTPTKFLGIEIPFANKLKKYLRKYESAETQFAKMHENIMGAKTEVERGVSELGTVRTKLWEGLEKLEKVVYFITKLDERITAEVETLKLTQADRARALEQEVLYYVRQNVGDVRAAQALTINAYDVFGELRKTGRETINGCDRVATLGMAALSIGVTMAKATGVQIKTQAMLTQSKKSVEDLISATGKALNDHVKATVEFSSNPMLGVQTLQNMFDQTAEAMDTLEAFRSNALEVQRTNNQMLGGLITKQMERLGNDRKAAAVADGIAL
jgi:uncharacterized protein YaaN involved in tellurite resistance